MGKICPEWVHSFQTTKNIQDPIDKSIKKYVAHPSICKIKNTMKFSDKSKFRKVTTEEVAIKIRQLNPRKASLPSVQRIYERLMRDQMLPFVQSFLSSLLCGFREGYGTQHALLRFVEACKKKMDNRDVAGTVLADLLKAFDCRSH